MTSHEAELQLKLIKARQEIDRLRGDVVALLEGIPLKLAITEKVSCDVAHPTMDIYHTEPHDRTRTVTAVVVGLA